MPAERGHAEDIYEGQTQERSWDANVKRTYDEFQDISLVAARRSQTQFDAISNIALQALQNAVENANFAAKQHGKHTADTDAQKVRHADVAIENQWESAEEVAMAQVAGHIATHHKDPGAE